MAYLKGKPISKHTRSLRSVVVLIKHKSVCRTSMTPQSHWDFFSLIQTPAVSNFVVTKERVTSNCEFS